MPAGPIVYQEIDTMVLADPENVVNGQWEHPEPGSGVSPGGFFTDEFEIDFTINDITPCPVFLLVYDEGPIFDGVPESDIDGIITVSRYKVA